MGRGEEKAILKVGGEDGEWITIAKRTGPLQKREDSAMIDVKAEEQAGNRKSP